MAGCGCSARDGGQHVCESETTLSHIQGSMTAEHEWLFAELSRLVQCGGLSVASHRAQEASRVGSDGLCMRMLWFHLLFDREGTHVQRLGLRILSLPPIESCQEVEAVRSVGMVSPQLLLAGG